MPMDSPIRHLKIIVMGDEDSGKAALIRSFTHKEPPSLPNAINHLIYLKNNSYSLSIYKTDFNNYHDLFTLEEPIRDNGVMILCNLTKTNSFDHVEEKIKKLREDGFKNIILVGTHAESSHIAVDMNRLRVIANKTECFYRYVDSKKEKFVNDLFIYFAGNIVNDLEKRASLYTRKFNKQCLNKNTGFIMTALSTAGVGVIPLRVAYHFHKPAIQFLVTTEKEEQMVKHNRALWRGDRPKPPKDPNKPKKEVCSLETDRDENLRNFIKMKEAWRTVKSACSFKHHQKSTEHPQRFYLVDKEQYRRYKLFTHPVDPHKVTAEMMEKSKGKSKKIVEKVFRRS